MKIPYTEINTFINEYYNGKYPNLRLGQAFIDHFDIVASDDLYNLFYETNNEIAEYTIYSFYIE